jgi:Uma2 family endonuclease
MNKPVFLGDAQHAPREPRRHAFSVDDVFRMQETGVLPPEHRCELMRGDLIEMPSEGDLHSFFKNSLIHMIARLVDPKSYTLGADTTFFLDRTSAPEPDLFVSRKNLRPSQVRGESALLVVEVADTSLGYDTGAKAELYAEYGVREYWVVDVKARRTLVYRLDASGRYGEPEDIAFETPLAAGLVPEIVLRMADLE